MGWNKPSRTPIGLKAHRDCFRDSPDTPAAFFGPVFFAMPPATLSPVPDMVLQGLSTDGSLSFEFRSWYASFNAFPP